MKTTQIKRLYLNSAEFVPITLAEAVVVNATDIPGLKSLGITTLDKVLSTTLGVVGTNALGIATLNESVNTINNALENKQDKLKAGSGIIITEDGTINATASVELYKIVSSLPLPSEECLNTIYLMLTMGDKEDGNNFTEYICIKAESSGLFSWEKIGTILTDVDLTGYITTELFNATIDPIKTDIQSIQETLKTTLTARNVTTSTGNNVLVDYTIPETLYDNI